MNLQDEKWMHAIRQFAGLLEQAEYEVFEAEAIIKKTKARLMLEATGKVIKLRHHKTYLQKILILYIKLV